MTNDQPTRSLPTHSYPYKSADGRATYVLIRGTVYRWDAERDAFLSRPGKAARKAAKKARQRSRA